MPDEDGADFMEDALDFARLKLAGNTKQVKACKKGYACGYTCISQNRNCRNPLQGQFKTASEWVAKQEGVSSGGEAKDKPPRKAGDYEEIKDVDITVTSKTGDITAWRRNPGNQELALKAAHQYAKKEKTDQFMFDGNSYMQRVMNIATGTDKVSMSKHARGSNRRALKDNPPWAPAIRVTPDGKVSQVKVFFS